LLIDSVVDSVLVVLKISSIIFTTDTLLTKLVSEVGAVSMLSVIDAPMNSSGAVSMTPRLW
jgi:hypothetical protein